MKSETFNIFILALGTFGKSVSNASRVTPRRTADRWRGSVAQRRVASVASPRASVTVKPPGTASFVAVLPVLSQFWRIRTDARHGSGGDLVMTWRPTGRAVASDDADGSPSRRARLGGRVGWPDRCLVEMHSQKGGVGPRPQIWSIPTRLSPRVFSVFLFVFEPHGDGGLTCQHDQDQDVSRSRRH